MEYVEYLRQKYNIEPEEERPSTADASLSTLEEDLYTEPRPATRGRPAAGGGSAADRLSRNRAARRAVTDLTHHNHLSTLYHMNRRIQEMYSKSGRRVHSLPGGVGEVEAAELACGGGWAEECGARPGTSGSQRWAEATPRIPGAPLEAPSHHRRPMSAPSPGQLAMQHAAAAEAAEAPLPHSRLATSMGLGTAAAVTAGGGAAKGAGPTTTFTERRVKNTAQALRTAILNEIIENRVYEEKRLRQLFRSYLKLNSGEVFYPTLCTVIEGLKQELDVK